MTLAHLLSKSQHLPLGAGPTAPTSQWCNFDAEISQQGIRRSADDIAGISRLTAASSPQHIETAENANAACDKRDQLDSSLSAHFPTPARQA